MVTEGQWDVTMRSKGDVKFLHVAQTPAENLTKYNTVITMELGIHALSYRRTSTPSTVWSKTETLSQPHLYKLNTRTGNAFSD